MRLPEGLGSMLVAFAVGTIIAGPIAYTQLGFLTGIGTAEQMATDAHTEGVVSIAAPICFERAVEEGPEAVSEILEIRYTSSQARAIGEKDWLDEEWPSQRDIATECARLLREAQAEG